MKSETIETVHVSAVYKFQLMFKVTGGRTDMAILGLGITYLTATNVALL